MRRILHHLSIALLLTIAPALADTPLQKLAEKHFKDDLQDVGSFPPRPGSKVSPMISIVCHAPGKISLSDAAIRIKERIAAFTTAFYGSGQKVDNLDISYHVVENDDLSTNKRELIVALVIPQATADKIKWGKALDIDPAVSFKTNGISPTFKPFWNLAR